MKQEEKKLTFRGGIIFSLIPVLIYVFFCVVLFIGFKAFNMEALAVGGFLALLIGGVFCTSYSDFWDSAIKGISSITSVSVVVILLLVGMFSQLIKTCGLSGGFVWMANAIGIRGGIFAAFTFLATCIVSTATGSSIGTMFIAFPIFYPAGLILGANEMFMAGSIVSGAIFGDNLAPISDTTIASSSTQQFHDGRPADIGGVVASRIRYSAVAGLITIVIFAIFGGMGGTYQGGVIDAGMLDLIASKILNSQMAQTYSGAELICMAGIALTTVLLGGVTSASILTFGPILNKIGSAKNIHPYRRANLLDGTANSLPAIVPFMSVFVFIGAALTGLSPVIVAGGTIYGFVLFAVFVFAVLTGWGRQKED